MSCKQLYKYIRQEITANEFSDHAKECRECRTCTALIDQTMEVLDEKIKVPEGLTRKVMWQVNNLSPSVVKRVDLNKYLQLAAVIIAGMLIGLLLGKNADSGRLMVKKDKSLGQFIEYEHFYDDCNLFRF